MRRLLLSVMCLLLSCLAPADATPSEQVRVGMAALEARDFPRAVKALDRAVRENPQSAEAQRLLGIACLKAATGEGATDVETAGRAVAALNESLRLEPDSAQTRYQLALAYLALDDKDAAVKEYQALLPRDAGLATQLQSAIGSWRAPQVFRSAASAGEGGEAGEASQTRVTVAGNTVFVPVTLSLGGRSVATTLVLDTGASVTVISKEVAQRLRVDLARAARMQAQVADGGTVLAWQIKLDRVSVGGRSRSGVAAAVVQSRGELPYDGLLGMNFLRSYKYSIDFRNQVINWH